MAKQKNLRKFHWVHPTLLKYLLINLALFCVTLSCLYFASELLLITQMNLVKNALPADSGQLVMTSLAEINSQRLWLLLSVASAFLLIIFSHMFFVFHRLTGPLYRLQKYLTEFDLEQASPLVFRKNDYLPEVAQATNEFIDKWLQPQRPNLNSAKNSTSRFTLRK